MAVWNDILDAVLDVDKPWTYVLARIVRDNPIAIAEGATGAPRVVPKALDFPYFMATYNGTTSFNGGTPIKVPANIEVYDPDAAYDNTVNAGNGYRFKPLKPGLYRVSVYAQCTEAPSTSSNMIVSVRKNGAEVASCISGLLAGSEVSGVCCETIVQMNGTTDYLEMWINNNNGASHILSSARFFAHAICEI